MAKALYYGDNLKVLRDSIHNESVDLIYLDPPFNSAANYNVIFREHKTGAPQAQITAFLDTWCWGEEAARTLTDLEQRHGELAQLLDFIVRTLGKNSLSAYLTMMGARLAELHRVLKPTGSLYLHCDPTASHYLKIILDILFGAKHFRNEIIWKRQSAHSDAKRQFAAVSDTILFYVKSDKAVFRPQYVPHDAEYLKKFYRHDDLDGRGVYRLGDMASPNPRPTMTYEWQGFPPPAKGWRYKRETMQALHDEGRIYYPTKPCGALDLEKRPALKRYLSEQEGSMVTNVWIDISPVQAQSRERLGYPTQKPLTLLERIIQASSAPGDVVLDPFCGCGTAVAAAEKLGRDWIGIDVTHLAVGLIQARLRRDYGLESGKDYALEGTPTDLDAARFLFTNTSEGPYQFQFWSLGLIGAQPYGAGHAGGKGKKGADTGIDGKLFFRTADGAKLETVIVSVKGGKNLNPGMVRDLAGTVGREKAALGVFITLEEPTPKMLSEAAASERYRYGRETFPKIQIITVQELLAGVRPKVPSGAANVSFEQKMVQARETPLFSERPEVSEQPHLTPKHKPEAPRQKG